jgi:hypothetical protein
MVFYFLTQRDSGEIVFLRLQEVIYGRRDGSDYFFVHYGILGKYSFKF